MSVNVAREVAALQRLSTKQLRHRFAEVFGDATNANNRAWLVRRIAWRLQCLAEGVFVAGNDREKAAKVTGSEGLGAGKDASKRLGAGKPMTGRPALRDMLDPALDRPTAEKVVARVAEWLGVPASGGPHATPGGGGPARGRTPSP